MQTPATMVRSFASQRGSIPYILVVAAAALIAIWKNIQTQFWLDETFTGAVSCQSSFAAMMPLIRHDAHPILYHILTHLLFGVVGCHLWAVRGLSILASLTGALILLREAGRLGGDVILAATLMFANPTFWQYAFEARSYSLLFLSGCGVVAYGFSDRRGAPVKAIAFALLGGALHYYASFLFAVLFAIVVCCRPALARSRIFWVEFVAAGLLLAGYYLPQLPESLAFGKTLAWIPPPSPIELLLYFPAMVFGNLFPAIIMAALTVIMCAAVIRRGHHPASETMLLIAMLAIFATCVFGASYVKPMFVYRYMHFLVPAIIMGLALLARDMKRFVGSGQQGTEYRQLLLNGIALYAGANAVMALNHSDTSRALAWQDAMTGMECSRQQPCAFVLDDPLLPSLDDRQYTVLANFFAKGREGFAAIRPDNLDAWLQKTPQGQLLYVQSSNPVLNIRSLVRNDSMTCKSFLKNGLGSLVCRKRTSE